MGKLAGFALRSVLAAVFAVMIGCDVERRPTPPPTAKAIVAPGKIETGADGSGSTAREDDTVDLTQPLPTLDAAGWQALLARHRGKVVLVDFWATWCPPCMEGFGHTVALAAKYDRDRFVVVAISLDQVEEDARVREFLASQNVTFPCFRSVHGAANESMDEFQIQTGTIPALRVYDQAGELAETFGDASEPIDYAAIDLAIRRLLIP